MGQVVCAWCGRFIRDDPRIKGVSHGMCASCHAKQMRELERLPPPPKTPKK